MGMPDLLRFHLDREAETMTKCKNPNCGHYGFKGRKCPVCGADMREPAARNYGINVPKYRHIAARVR
jgi:rRNA maturation protein Nop10